jgi:hypothetical protein
MWKSLKRWPVLLALLVAVGALAVGIVFLPASRVTRENCERIKEGMTEAEVRAILGKPCDNSLLDAEEAPLDDARYVVKPREKAAFLRGVWASERVVMYVAFDDNNNRVACAWVATNSDRSWLPARVWRRLRARVGW